MSDRLFARLDELERDFEELTTSLADPVVLGDRQRYAEVAKRHSDLAGIVATYRTYREATGDAAAARELARESDPDDQAAFRAEAEELDRRAGQLLDDLRVDVYRSSGPGGQSVNTTDSAVRITHVPTGLVVSCQDEKSQLQNREKALRILRARLLQLEQERAAKERAEARLSQIGTGDRSEKIRTYNFPQDRVTDHRIGLSVHNLSEVMDGALHELLAGLVGEEQRRRLEALALAE